MKRTAALMVLGFLAVSPAFADGMRCGTKLVGEGASRAEVAAKCGEPTDVIERRTVMRRPVIWDYGRPMYVGEDYVEVPVEVWLYNLGPNKLMRRITFEGGYVIEIETLGYGYNP
jgi:hypothetical protein